MQEMSKNDKSFDEANKILAKYGFKSLTKEAQGSVMVYEYKHARGYIIYIIRSITVDNADHWVLAKGPEALQGKLGYWKELEPFLKVLTPIALT